MKHKISAALCALTFTALSGNALAVPIYFDFTGTVFTASGSYANSGLEGTAVSGGFAFETGDLTPFLAPDLAFAQYFDGPNRSSTAYFHSAALDVSLPLHPQNGSAGIFFTDTDCSHLPYCSPRSDWYEGFQVSGTWGDEYTPGYVGQLHLSAFGVSSLDYDWANFASFDWASATPIDIVSRPLANVYGSYGDTLYTCGVDGSCTSESPGIFEFSIDSVTRGIGPRAAVPEPDTLALFALGFAGLLVIRRRRAAAR
jgi:hypothetical protein